MSIGLSVGRLDSGDVDRFVMLHVSRRSIDSRPSHLVSSIKIHFFFGSISMQSSWKNSTIARFIDKKSQKELIENTIL